MQDRFNNLLFLISRTCWNVILSRGSLQKKPCSTLISQISVHLRFLIASCRHSAPRIAHPSPRRFIRTSHNTANPSDFQAPPIPPTCLNSAVPLCKNPNDSEVLGPFMWQICWNWRRFTLDLIASSINQHCLRRSGFYFSILLRLIPP